MRAVVVALLGALLGGACANNPETGFGGSNPSYLGAFPAEAREIEAATVNNPSDIARHVGSNKVLGAMAFQKVTGRSVDPQRLVSTP